ncbi:hypothetical protein QQY66_47120 [Streptomyces sp. DG2A-72]|uniref:hypothetical protein n=1 Tax=Streptomyces sp. DG2A-72 TaxID=3051386 RepID=UPI00265C6975|nr:hypothetical protein [Streptomyces sp. DG2A-72]MDO0938924.1 hypothetical protein [Streptomyces sp. DG2A-72]
MCTALLALTAISSCSSSPKNENNSEPEIPAIPRIIAAASLRLPLQDYLLTDRQLRDLDQARVVLIDRCMRRFGFGYSVQQPTANYGPRSATERRYGITDASDAAEHGYGLGNRDPALQKPPAKPRLGVDAQTVLFGKGRSSIKGLKVPDGGCVAQADQSLGTTAPAGTDPGLAQQLSFQSFDRSKADSRVLKVTRAWSDCMAHSGYEYTDPLAPLADPGLSGSTSARTIGTATTDIRCKKSTNLVGVWFAVESAYQKQLIDQNSEQLKGLKQANGARARAADALTAGG